MSSHNPPSDSDDYDPRQLIQELSAKLEQPHKFADVFCAAAESQKKIDDTLKKVVKNLIKNDPETKKDIKELVAEVNKENWKNVVKKIWLAVWSIFLIILTAVIQRFFFTPAVQ